MITTAIAALAVGLLAPLVRAWLWGVPFGLLSVSTVLVAFVGSALTTLVIGVLTQVGLQFVPSTPAQSDLISGVTAACGGVLLLLLSARRMRYIRGLTILCGRLLEEDVREQTLTALDKLLEGLQRKAPNRHAGFVLLAIGPLTQAGLWDDARERLVGLDTANLDETQSAMRNQALATCEFHFGNLEAADKALAAIARPTVPKIEVWLNASDALLLALRGRGDEALALLADPGDDNPSLVASHRIVRAHALSAKGEEARARTELIAVRDEAGLAGLERATQPEGPASPLARTLLDESSQG